MSVKRTSELDETDHLSAGDLFDISEDQGDTTYVSKKITAANTVGYITTGLLSSATAATTYAKLDGSNTPFTGNIGVGIAPTAVLHIKAGTATAGTAPLKFTDGTLLATPEPGVINFANERFYITNVATNRAIDRTSDVATATVTVTNTVDETLVYTGLVPANSLRAGNILKLNMSGQVDEAAVADDVTIRVKFGGVTMATIVSPGQGVALKCWHVVGFATLRSVGVLGSMAWHIDMDVAGNSADACGVSTVNTTASANVTVTAQWNNAKAGNIFTLTQGFMEYKN